METNRNDRNRGSETRVQLRAALLVTGLGCCLLVAGFVLSPAGEIHQSVLIGFGECLTFAGSLLGIDYRYKK